MAMGPGEFLSQTYIPERLLDTSDVSTEESGTGEMWIGFWRASKQISEQADFARTGEASRHTKSRRKESSVAVQLC